MKEDNLIQLIFCVTDKKFIENMNVYVNIKCPYCKKKISILEKEGKHNCPICHKTILVSIQEPIFK